MVLNNPCQDYPDWMPRVFYPAFRGIIIRGIERKKIFRDNKDRDILMGAVRELVISGMYLVKRLR
jgi:nicotinamidase-related amidase